MSTTPDYDLAPSAATAPAPPPAAGQPTASGAAAVTDPGAQRTQRRRSASQKGDGLAGLLIPGGAITGLIGLCWLVHAFGLPVVVFAILAAAATVATAVVIKVSRRAAKAVGRRHQAGGAGGAGPGGRGSRRNGRGGGGRSGHRGLRTSNRSGGGPTGSNVPGAVSRKPAGLGATKSLSNRSGATNSSKGRLGTRGGLGGGRSTSGPKPLKGSLTKGSSGGRRSTVTPGGVTNGTGGSGLLGKLGSGISPGFRGTGSTKPNRKTGATGGEGGLGKAPRKTPGGTNGPLTPKSSGTRPPAGGGKGGKGRGKSLGPKGPGKKGKGSGPKHRRRHSWRKNPIRKTGGLLKAGATRSGKAARRAYASVTSKKFRRRLHRAATPFRAMYRGTSKHGGKLLANMMRIAGRGILSAHTALGTVRLSATGPNWLKPLSKVLHWATSPLAKLVSHSRRWTWLSTWIYKTATARPITKPAKPTPAVPAAGTGTPAPASGGHTPVPSPATAPTGGTPVATSPAHHAYPLIYAAQAIRAASAAFAAAPADSMKGYENVIENLGHLEFAMCHLMHNIAQVTEDDFKVNPEISNQFRTVGVQFLLLGAFVDSAHQVFREVHAEQLDNIENPTWQGRKWDISANWAHILPPYAGSDPTVHAMPLLLASSAIRDAGVHIGLHPTSSMFGYETTIEHLAPLAEALYELMETVASTTESEFVVHPAIPAMHRDAGQRFRDLGGAIQGVHYLYRTLHQEQLLNLENPSYQAAKWDAGRNAS